MFSISVHSNKLRIHIKLRSKDESVTIQNGQLCKNNSPVPCIQISEALKQLNSWFKNIETKLGPISLFGYNSHGFDNRALVRNYRQTQTPFPNIETSFDILPKIRKSFPRTEVDNHKLETVARLILTNDPILNEPDFHSSLFDCKILRAICNKICSNNCSTLTKEFNEYSKPFSYFLKIKK